MKHSKIRKMAIKESKKLLSKLGDALIDIRVNKKINQQNIKDVYFSLFLLRDIYVIIGNRPIVDFLKRIILYTEQLLEIKASTTENLVKSFFIVNDHINVLVESYINDTKLDENFINEGENIQRNFRKDVKAFLDDLGFLDVQNDLDVPIKVEPKTNSLVSSKHNYTLKPDKLTRNTISEILSNIEDEISEHSVANVTLDLSNTKEFDTAGLQFLIKLSKICKDRKVKLKLINLSSKIKEIFDMYNIHISDIEVL